MHFDWLTGNRREMKESPIELESTEPTIVDLI
jgi:hypothetical protein